MLYVKDAVATIIGSVLVALGAVCGILLGAFLLFSLYGCGGRVQEIDGEGELDAGELDAGSDSDADTDTDSDSDSDSDTGSCNGCLEPPFDTCSPIGSCDEEQGSVCIGVDTWAPSCPNGTCDCGEDSDSCPLDCPVVWTECTLLPADGTPTTCDAICEARGMFCTETCESETDGNLHGVEGCGGDDPPGTFGPCSIAWSGDGDEAVRCCCGREAA